MDKIELAVLPADTPLATALATMHSRGQSGLVRIKDDNKLELVHVGAVVAALAKGKSALADVGKSEKIAARDAPLKTVHFPPGVRWSVTVEDATDVFRRLGPDAFEKTPYVLTQLGLGSAWIATKSESLANSLRVLPRYCYCTNKKESHGYDHASHGPTCDFDDSAVVCGPRR